MFTVEVPKTVKRRTPRKDCPMCLRRKPASAFVRFDVALPCCAQCSINFVYFTVAGHP